MNTQRHSEAPVAAYGAGVGERVQLARRLTI